MEKNRGNRVSKVDLEKIKIRSSTKEADNCLDISGFSNHNIQKPEKDSDPRLKNRFKKVPDSSGKKDASML